MKTSLLHAAFFTPMGNGAWGLPLILWGDPGIAKTSIVRQLAKQYGLHCEHLAPGERGEGAFGVTPVPIGENGSTVLEYPPPDWVRKLRGDDGEEAGIVFVDELNTAPPALQPALLGAIQERRIGGHTFGPRVRVIGAANPVGQAAGGWDIAPPVANRLGHIDWPPPEVDEWSAWLLGGSEQLDGLDALEEEKRVAKAWPLAYAKAAGLATAFLYRRPNLLHKMPGDGDPAASRAWPSARSWEYAVRARASADVHGLTQLETDELVTAFLGAGPAGEWGTWIDEADLPDPADLLDGKVKWEHDPERLDRTMAVLSSCAALVAPKQAQKRKSRVKAVWGLLSAVMEDAKDLCVPPMQALVRAQLQRTQEARPVLAKMHSVVQAAGMTTGGRR